MTHHLVPVSKLPRVPDTRTNWRCVRCGKRWENLEPEDLLEECDGDAA